MFWSSEKLQKVPIKRGEFKVWKNLWSFSFVSYSQIECTQSNSARNGVPRAIYDAMRSFPSGHAQLSTHCAVFVILYVQNRIGTHFSSLWKHLLQMAFLVFALVCSISRIVDKRHHWWDVLAGMLIGAVLAIVTVSGFICSTWSTVFHCSDILSVSHTMEKVNFLGSSYSEKYFNCLFKHLNLILETWT